MALNEQKTTFGQSLIKFGRDVQDLATKVLGKSLPASVAKVMGPTVVVKYEVSGSQTLNGVRMPILQSKYVRLPIQAGEKGGTISFDAYMGGMSGLGGGTADTAQRGNLATSAWAPVSNSDWATEDTDTLTLTGGPNGVKLKDATGSAVMTISHTGFSLSFGGHTLLINNTGVVIDGRIFLTHEHSGVQPGGGNSGGVV